MRTFLVLFFIIFLFSNLRAQVANKIDKLDVNQLKLPKESVSRAVYLDANGQVKSSSTISDTELGYLEGLSDTLVNLLSGKANDADVVKLTGNQTVSGIKTFDGKLVTLSTVNGAIPCPVMTEVQRDAFTPAQADCVYNSTTLKLNVFDGSVWKDVGGAGGISLWLTANPYNVNDIVIESDKIYRCLIAHTSGTFATDLVALKWVEVSQGLTAPVSLADGGTNKNITASAGSVVYVDADSFEQISGTSGQVLQSNGSSAPTFVNKSISAKSQNNASVIAEEIQVPNNLLTQVDTNKHLNETGNKNILSNPSFEHSTFSTSWTNVAGTFTQETSIVIDGKASAKLVLSAQTMSLTQSSTLYQAQFADGVQGLASVKIKSDIVLKVCSIVAGVVSTTECVDTDSSNTWRTYKVPFILGAASNGISIASSGSVTGTVYTDDSFVGPMDLTSGAITCTSSSCETVLSAFVSSTGVVSNENVDWISGNASKTTGIYTFTFNSGLATVPMNCTATEYGVTGVSRVLAIRSSTSTTVIVGTKSAADGTTLVDNDFQLICQKQGADWTKAEANKTGGIYSNVAGAESVDVFSAKISSAGVISGENIDWLSTCSVASAVYTCNFNSSIFTQNPNCSVLIAQQSVGQASKYVTSSSTQLIYRTTDGASPSASAVEIICQKQGADFKASKLIVGSFKGVVTTPNTNKTSFCSAKISSTGVISDQRGGCFASCTNATTPVCTFTSNYWVSGQVPNCWMQTQTAGYVNGSSTNSTTFSAISANTSGVAISGDRVYFCHGEIQ